MVLLCAFLSAKVSALTGYFPLTLIGADWMKTF